MGGGWSTQHPLAGGHCRLRFQRVGHHHCTPLAAHRSALCTLNESPHSDQFFDTLLYPSGPSLVPSNPWDIPPSRAKPCTMKAVGNPTWAAVADI